MRKSNPLLAPAIAMVVMLLPTSLRAQDKKTLTVTAVTHDSRLNEQTSYRTNPGQSTTNCTGTGTDSGADTVRIRMDCDTKTTLPTTTATTTRTTDVTEKVIDSDNMVYTIACTDRPNILAAAIAGGVAGAAGSGGTLSGSGKCVPLVDGDRFEAEIKGTTMWVRALRGGNHGKAIKIKYKILDVRKQAPVPVAANSDPKPKNETAGKLKAAG